MSNTIDDLIGGVELEGGYLTDAWLDRLRAFDFLPHDGARFLAWLPNIKPHLACCAISRNHVETPDDAPAEFIEFHTGGWSGAEEFISTMLEHVWINYFHTKWSKGGHFTFEVPTGLLLAPTSDADGPKPSPNPSILDPHQIAPLNDIVGFMLFTASRSGSWQAWRLFGPDERQRFLKWAEQELTNLRTLGWTLSVEHHETHPLSLIEGRTA